MKPIPITITADVKYDKENEINVKRALIDLNLLGKSTRYKNLILGIHYKLDVTHDELTELYKHPSLVNTHNTITRHD